MYRQTGMSRFTIAFSMRLIAPTSDFFRRKHLGLRPVRWVVRRNLFFHPPRPRQGPTDTLSLSATESTDRPRGGAAMALIVAPAAARNRGKQR